jgi:hypothetical protein
VALAAAVEGGGIGDEGNVIGDGGRDRDRGGGGSKGEGYMHGDGGVFSTFGLDFDPADGDDSVCYTAEK